MIKLKSQILYLTMRNLIFVRVCVLQQSYFNRMLKSIILNEKKKFNLYLDITWKKCIPIRPWNPNWSSVKWTQQTRDGTCAWLRIHWANTKRLWNWRSKVSGKLDDLIECHVYLYIHCSSEPFSAVLGSPPDDLTCNITTPNSVRLRWTDLNANNLMSDYVQGYVLTYSKVVPPDDLISKLYKMLCICLS